jgi:SPP1 family predicted phage head-tail adaptor
MRSGQLDRRIVIQSMVEALDGAGQPIKTWSEFATVWAKRKDLKGQERFAAQQRLATRTTIYRIRWLSGLGEKMRVLDEGSTYEIIGVAGERRQGWAELSCEALNPAELGGS